MVPAAIEERIAMKRKRAGRGESEPQRPIDAALLEEWALSYLARYAGTAGTLRQVLRRRVRRRLGSESGAGQEDITAIEGLIEALVERCRATGLVDDATYAASRARRGVVQGRSLQRIAAGLAAKGVAAEDAAAAIDALRGESPDPELAAAIAFARRRRLGPFRRDPHPPAPADLHGAELAAFARAGFTRRTAELVLASRDEAAVRALLADDLVRDGPDGTG